MKTKAEIISDRHTICSDLYYSGKESIWKKQDFYTAYKNELIKAGLANINISNSTIYRDCSDIGISFNKKTTKKNKQQSYLDFGRYMGNYISQIRCTCKSHDIIILNDLKEAESLTKEEITNRLYKIIDAAKSKYDKTKTSAKKTITPQTMIHLYFIYTVRGFENRLAEILDSQKINERDFLYISIHNYCTEIVFEFQYLDKYIERIYSICSSI